MSGPLVTKCAGALACQQWPGDSASLGQFSSVSYADTNNGVIVTASGGTPDDGIARQMSLTITCGPSPGDPYPTFTNEDSSSLTYSFTWSRPEACGSGCGAGPTPPGPPSPPGPPGPTTQHEGLDVGWWVFIFLFVFIAVYFIGGIIFMAVVKGARGVEMVPNLTFWTDLPALVKDGCLFLVSKVRRDRSSFSSV
jgi:hypothetical protein